MSTPSLSRQISAIEAAIAIAFDGRLKPRSASQAAMLRDDALAALATLRRVGELPEDFLKRARLYVG